MAGSAISSATAITPCSPPLAIAASKCGSSSQTSRLCSSRSSMSNSTAGHTIRVAGVGRIFLARRRTTGRLSLVIANASVQPPEQETAEVEEQSRIASPGESSDNGKTGETSSSKSPSVEKELSKVVMKTAATFAPRASTASKNPAPPGSTLYKVFEAQAYVAMVLGGALSFNLLFPSDHPDIWRLMGMWSVWMFTVPSLRARDCSKNEKEALNYLFLAIPLINVTLPLVWKSFAAVWSADVLAFFSMYAWKLEWLSREDEDEVEDS